MLIKENNKIRQNSNIIAAVDSTKLALSNRIPSKIPLRVPAPNRSLAPNRMPAAKPNGANIHVAHKHPMFMPHKQNIPPPRALSPVIPINGPRSLVANNTGYTQHAEIGIVNGNYIQGQSMTHQQHHSYIATNIANKQNVFQSGNIANRGATVINGNGIPLYRQASATTLISPSALKQGNNWKLGFNSTSSKDDKNRVYIEQHEVPEKGHHSLISPIHHNEVRQGSSNKPGKCENKVRLPRTGLHKFICLISL